MAKLKKTLPKNLIHLVEHKDWETLKTELLKCEPMAYEHYSNWSGNRANHILFASYCMSYKNWYCLSAEMVEWIIDNNNFDFADSFWDNLLNFYIERKQTQIVEVLLKRGFEPSRNNALNFALKMGSQHYRDIVNPEIVELLLQYGAEVQKDNDEYSEPLQTLLLNIYTFNTYIYLDKKHFERLLDNFPDYLKIIKLLISYSEKSNLYQTQKIL